MKQFKKIAVNKISPPRVRDRLEVDEEYIAALAADIKENGLINPILVRPSGDVFEVVAGERRLLAIQNLGWKLVACHVQDLDDSTASVLRAVENLDRVDLSPIEEGRIYERLMRDHNMTRDQVAKRVGKSAGVVKRRVDLLRMPENLQGAIHAGKISYGVAEELQRLGDTGAIDYYLGWCVDHGATVTVVREWVRQHHRDERVAGGDIVEGGGVVGNIEPAPSYIACCVCRAPVVLGREVVMRVCEDCFRKMSEAVRG